MSRFYDGIYIEFPLSSSALGDNFLKLYDTPGIIRLDMMKIIQRDHKLDSYKLDSVSAVFIL
jgi:DNA polymerase elongation subunit (family B)